MYPRLKSDLEDSVESGEMPKEEAEYRLQTYRKYMLLPWPIGGFYVTAKMNRYYKDKQKEDPTKG